jgi:hypothetical protein
MKQRQECRCSLRWDTFDGERVGECFFGGLLVRFGFFGELGGDEELGDFFCRHDKRGGGNGKVGRLW